MGTQKLLALIALGILPFLVHAEIYKYVDDKGKTHYTDSPPKNVKNVTVPEFVDTQVSPLDHSRAQAQARKDIEATRENVQPAGGAVSTGPAGDRELQCRQAQGDLDYWSKAAFNAKSPATYEREMRDRAIWEKRKYCS